MQFAKQDIWKLYEGGMDVVITTNIGWDPVTFENNMGAGTALQAYRRCPSIAVWYGHECRRMATSDAVDVLYRGDLGLYFLPVKPLLDQEDPERSWDQVGDYDLIESMLERMSYMNAPRPVAMTLPGCGNGGLDAERMLGLVLKHLGQRKDLTLCDLQLPAPVAHAQTPRHAERHASRTPRPRSS